MELNTIIKRHLRSIGLDRNDLLIEGIKKKLEPALEKEAEKLLTNRMIKKAFDELLRAMRAPQLAPIDENPPTTTKE